MRPGEKLYDAITQVRDDLVDDAVLPVLKEKKVPSPWRKWTAVAAAVALVIGLGGYGLTRLGGLGGSSGNESSGSGGTDGATEFMSYAGPVFPITVLEGSEGLSAVRALTYDFSPWKRVWVSNEEQLCELNDLSKTELEQAKAEFDELFPDGGYWSTSRDLLVTDSYTLTNESGEDKTLTLLYPFTGTYRELDALQPVLSVDGAQADTVLYGGPYSGGFTGVSGDDEGKWNLDQLNSWEEYKALLESGEYQSQALGGGPDFTSVPVTVYQVTDAYAPEPDDINTNPTLAVQFELDYEKTTVLAYGFNGARWDVESGWMSQDFTVPQKNWSDAEQSYYLILLGEDIENYTVQGYRTGAVEEGNELDGVGATVTRYETDLDSVLRQVMAEYACRYRGNMDEPGSYLFAETMAYELYYRSVCEMLEAYSVLSDNPIERYGVGWLDDIIMEAAVVQRVFYLEMQVTIPAGGTVTVTAEMRKEPSYDYYGADRGTRGLNGFDMVTRINTCLTFETITAELVNCDCIEVINQNYGFDIAAGVLKVSLDHAQEHYYMEVSHIPEK